MFIDSKNVLKGFCNPSTLSLYNKKGEIEECVLKRVKKCCKIMLNNHKFCIQTAMRLAKVFYPEKVSVYTMMYEGTLIPF